MKNISLDNWSKLIILLVSLGILFGVDSVFNLSSKNTFKQNVLPNINPPVTQAPTPQSTQSNQESQVPTVIILPTATPTVSARQPSSINSIRRIPGGEGEGFGEDR